MSDSEEIGGLTLMLAAATQRLGGRFTITQQDVDDIDGAGLRFEQHDDEIVVLLEEE